MHAEHSARASTLRSSLVPGYEAISDPAHGQRPHARAIQKNSIIQCPPCKAPRSTVDMYGKTNTITRCPCTPLLTLEMFGEEISAKACSSKEIAGLKKKKNMMTQK